MTSHKATKGGGREWKRAINGDVGLGAGVILATADVRSISGKCGRVEGSVRLSSSRKSIRMWNTVWHGDQAYVDDDDTQRVKKKEMMMAMQGNPTR